MEFLLLTWNLNSKPKKPKNVLCFSIIVSHIIICLHVFTTTLLHVHICVGTPNEKKFPGLTDLKVHKDTARKRLERKILSKRSLKKVAKDMDSATAKKFQDKFGYSFNYALRSWDIMVLYAHIVNFCTCMHKNGLLYIHFVICC